ncbi:hypothetical protein [Flagellimonas nanhaiensis]|uniref:N-acetyltransferase n=1 Tax=Flagellimonas nanhaiensis TaxID=2292706 RepID=A0A371JQL2_9FLAO|nr:hypothetical protein [Allomuricauda nanhaiensis]RDY59776.1 hypothetical protein DX873_10460 [Allomuricauda nanhaiensis]
MYENTIVPLIFRSSDSQLFYEFILNGQSASIEYRFIDETRLLLLRATRSKYLGEEVTLALIERIIDHARRMDYEVYAQCPLILQYLKTNKRLGKFVGIKPVVRQQFRDTLNESNIKQYRSK